jgi:hypothetical protein
MYLSITARLALPLLCTLLFASATVGAAKTASLSTRFQAACQNCCRNSLSCTYRTTAVASVGMMLPRALCSTE